MTFPSEKKSKEAILPAYSSLVLAVAALLFTAFVAVKLRNTAVILSDIAATKKLKASITTLEAKLAIDEAILAKLPELLQIGQRIEGGSKAYHENQQDIATLEQSVEKALASQGKKKNKKAEAEFAKLRSKSSRQLASLRDRGGELERDVEQSVSELNEKLKAIIAAPSPASTAAPEGSAKANHTDPK